MEIRFCGECGGARASHAPFCDQCGWSFVAFEQRVLGPVPAADAAGHTTVGVSAPLSVADEDSGPRLEEATLAASQGTAAPTTDAQTDSPATQAPPVGLSSEHAEDGGPQANAGDDPLPSRAEDAAADHVAGEPSGETPPPPSTDRTRPVTPPHERTTPGLQSAVPPQDAGHGESHSPVRPAHAAAELRLRAGSAAAAAAALLAIVLWRMLGPLSLLIDVALGLWVLNVGLGGGLKRNPLEAIPRLLRLLASPQASLPAGTDGLSGWVRGDPRRRLPGLAIAGAAIPLAVGLLAGLFMGVHHSSIEDVCEAYTDFVTLPETSPTSFDLSADEPWFDALEDMGSAAADLSDAEGRGDTATIREAGRQTVSLATNDGKSGLVSVSVGEAEMTYMPIAVACAQGGP